MRDEEVFLLPIKIQFLNFFSNYIKSVFQDLENYLRKKGVSQESFNFVLEISNSGKLILGYH